MKVIKEYKDKKGIKKIILETRYGKVESNAFNINLGHKPTINTAIDKNIYFQAQLDNIYKENTVILQNNYIDNKTKVIVKTFDGLFEVLPKNLLKGVKLGIRSSINKSEFFINKAKNIHNNIYDYSLSNYINNKTSIKIKCDTHGIFEQSPAAHLKGHGCSKCAYNKTAETRLTYSKGISNAIVYILEIEDIDKTIFYKIGFTRHSIDYRYHKKWLSKVNRVRMPYSYKKLYEFILPYKEAINLEKSFHNQLGEFTYKPLLKFDGSATECYLNINILKKK